MKRLYVFGDSFTDANIISNNKSYIQWKGYTPKTFHQIISEKLSLEVVNFARDYGIDNYTIFNHICDNIDSMDGSIVIINWSETMRFRMVDTSTQKWRSVLGPHSMRIQRGLPFVNGVPNDTILNTIENRKNKLWIKEVESWINIINKALKNSIVIHWGWSNVTYRETITEETNGEVVDFHYSEKGHSQLADWIMVQIENGGYHKSPYSETSIL
jgi:hypothetical protein